MKTLPVTIYKDTTRQYTDEECDIDNTIEIPVPFDLLFAWWNEQWDNGDEFYAEFSGNGERIPQDVEGFIRWVNEESTADDTIDLYRWLIDHNYYWKRLKGEI